MKQWKRFTAILLSVSMVFFATILFSGEKQTQVTYRILNTMSGSGQLTKLAFSDTSVSEPYYRNQWYLENDGTFAPSTEHKISRPGIIRVPNAGSTPDTSNDNQLLRPVPESSRNRKIPVRNPYYTIPGSIFDLYGTKSVSQQGIFFRMVMQSDNRAVPDVDINASEAWKTVGDSGREVIVAVIDTGVDYTHEDLKNSIWINQKEIASDGIDNDNNGYVDDVYGWDFYNNKPFEVTSNSSEYNHGTHIAGVIAASADNGTGITGIFPNDNVKIMSIKVLGGSDGSGVSYSVVKAIQYAEKMGASICNLSFGTSNNDAALKAAIEDSQMLFVCAAGNAANSYAGDNTDLIPTYPAAYDLDNIISVANLSFNGSLDLTSNYGQNSVDIAAPGSYIFSTVTGNSYEYMSGSSMAAPMVTGVAALVYSFYEDLPLSSVKDILLESVKPSSSLTNKVATGGMLDAANALTYAASE